MFQEFDLGLLERMTYDRLTLHIHNYAIEYNEFLQDQKLLSFYKVTSTDSLSSGLKYANTFEAYEYPIFGVLFHPEYRLNLNPIEDTEAIVRHFAELIRNATVSTQDLTISTKQSKPLIFLDEIKSYMLDMRTALMPAYGFNLEISTMLYKL